MVVQRLRVCLPILGMQAGSLDQEDPREKEMATHFNSLAWEIPWTEELGRLQSVGSQKSWIWLSD